MPISNQITALRKLSAQVSVAVAGTAVRGPDLPAVEGIRVSFPNIAGNAGQTGYVGNDGVTAPNGDVDATNGFAMAPGDPPILVPISNANLLWFDGSAACTFSLMVA
jgi:prepilin-type processing-associated H-X9-DG protein